MAAQYPAFDVAVLRLIHDVLATARAAGKHAGICGEMAGDPVAIPLLIGLGARELSMGSARLDAARQLILSLIHISEPTRPYSISSAVFCLKKNKQQCQYHCTAYHKR